MSTINDGGPAFAGTQRIRRAGYDTNEFEPVNGMSLRDYFAAKAMQAYIERYTPGDQTQAITYDADVAKWAYESADAMLKARQS